MSEHDHERRVVCAANRVGNIIVPGPRHYSPLMHDLRLRMLITDDDWRSAEQGFIDQWGVFMTREDALVVAREAGQLEGRTKTHPERLLFSEDLY